MKIKVLYSKKNEKILKVDDIYLNSLYDAKREAKILIDGYKELLNNDVIHVIGFGMGYHIIELLNRIKDNQLIKVYDTNEKIYKQVKNEKQIGRAHV